MSNIVPINPGQANQHAISRESLDELIAMCRDVWLHIEKEPDPRRAGDLAEIFDMFGEILADVERTPIAKKERNQ